MIQEQFQKWIPIDNLGSAYDVENITWGDGLSFLIVGTNTIVDVIAKDYPSVKSVERY